MPLVRNELHYKTIDRLFDFMLTGKSVLFPPQN